jgi:hypothetical protein
MIRTTRRGIAKAATKGNPYKDASAPYNIELVLLKLKTNADIAINTIAVIDKPLRKALSSILSSIRSAILPVSRTCGNLFRT